MQYVYCHESLSEQLLIFKAKLVLLDTKEGALSEDVVIDSDGETILVMVGDVSKTESFVSTVNLHDLRTVSFFLLSVVHAFVFMKVMKRIVSVPFYLCLPHLHCVIQRIAKFETKERNIKWLQEEMVLIKLKSIPRNNHIRHLAFACFFRNLLISFTFMLCCE